MKPSYPWLAPVALLTLAGASCAPDNKVKPGAPVLMSINIQDGSGRSTEITADTPLCTSDGAPTGECDPSSGLCFSRPSSWCTCVAVDEMDPTKGEWSCAPLAPTSIIVATFDRLLDTAPLDFDRDGGASGVATAATFEATPGTAPASNTEYVSTGDPVGLIFPLVFGIKGPRLFISATPTLPANSTITLTLDGTKIRAKDGKTPFTADGLLADGVISFMTEPLTATIAVPMAEVDAGAEVDSGADAAADADDLDAGVSLDAGVVDGGAADAATDTGDAAMPPPAPPPPVMPGDQTVTVAFNNATDPATTPAHIIVTVNGAPFADVDITQSEANPLGYSVKPKTMWPANATVVITVDAAAADVQGVTLGAPASATFVTGS